MNAAVGHSVDMVSEPKKSFVRYTAEIDEWLPDFLELGPWEAGPKRTTRLLEYFDLLTSGGREVFHVMRDAAKMTANECQVQLSTDEKELEEWKNLNLDEQRWEVAKRHLKRLIAPQSTPEAEDQLRQLSRKCDHETELDFCKRFCGLANQFVDENKVTMEKSVRILLLKLPARLQDRVTYLDLVTATLDEVLATVRNYIGWTHVLLDAEGRLEELDEEVCAEEDVTLVPAAAAYRTKCDAVLEDGVIRYDRVTNAARMMVAWKKLIETPRYFREAEKALQSLPGSLGTQRLGTDRGRTHDGLGDEAFDALVAQGALRIMSGRITDHGNVTAMLVSECGIQ